MKKMHIYNIYRINYINKIKKIFHKIILCLIRFNKNSFNSIYKHQLLIWAKIFPKIIIINNNSIQKLIMKCTCYLLLINIKVIVVIDFQKIKYIQGIMKAFPHSSKIGKMKKVM